MITEALKTQSLAKEITWSDKYRSGGVRDALDVLIGVAATAVVASCGQWMLWRAPAGGSQ